MKTNIWMLVAAAMTSALTGACTAEVGNPSEEITETNSELRVMNGDRLSGVSLSGINVNGAFLNGVRYIGMRINGVLISNVTLNGTVLSGQLPNGTVLSGTDFISARMTGTLTDGTEITLRIDDIVVSGDADILNYKITHLQAGGNTAPICGTNSDGTYVLGFPLAGRWDHTSGTATGGAHIDDATRFTIACRGAALAKCAEQGYKPFKTVQECNSSGNCQAVGGRALHQACVRMIRADYCGDGTSHTVVGTEIDMYDAFGVKIEDPTAVWDLEAEWTASGAACVLHTRWISTDNGNVEDYMRDHCPERFTPPVSGVECGRDSSTFFTDNGYSVPVEQRVVFRNKSEVHP